CRNGAPIPRTTTCRGARSTSRCTRKTCSVPIIHCARRIAGPARPARAPRSTIQLRG
ncbi:MAG: Sulfite dehydrogenase (quinone), iron-sulfur subunit SoeB (EC 1.8.5.6), partial [Olavius algarvensis Gamma 3 endosymbiont]